MQSPHEIAEAARHELMMCAFALEEAAGLRGKDMLDVLTAPLVRWKLRVARGHRAAAKRQIDRLHAALHERAALGVHNADLWSAVTRAADALALSRWMNTKQLAREDISPSAATVHILLGELADLIGLLHELAWPDEMNVTDR